MRRSYFFLLLPVLLLNLYSCGEKPGSLRNLEDVVPEFTDRLNDATVSGNYTPLIRLFDENATLLLKTEFNPEVMNGRGEIEEYFLGYPKDTEFNTSDLQSSELTASAEYSYIQPNDKTGSGVWHFKLNNSGKIAEMTIVPAEELGEEEL